MLYFLGISLNLPTLTSKPPTSLTSFPRQKLQEGAVAKLFLFGFPLSALTVRAPKRVIHNTNPVMAWKCVLCAGFSALWLLLLLTHYNSEHTNHGDRHFTIRCGIDRCAKEYTKVNSFTKHVRSVHTKFLYSSFEEAGGQPVLLQGKLFQLAD